MILHKMARAGLHCLGMTNEAKFKRAMTFDRAKYPADYLLADRVLEKFHSQGGLKQYIQQYKLVSLHRLLTKHKPNTILELGTGSSSVIFANYAKKSGARVVHIDESKKWLNNTKRNVLDYVGDSYDNSEYVFVQKDYDLNKSPVQFWYDYEIEQEYDLLFLDGPALIAEGNEYKEAICMDVFNVVDSALPKCIVVDMRQPTTNEIENSFNKKYEAIISSVLNRNPCEGFDYFSVFERKY